MYNSIRPPPRRCTTPITKVSRNHDLTTSDLPKMSGNLKALARIRNICSRFRNLDSCRSLMRRTPLTSRLNSINRQRNITSKRRNSINRRSNSNTNHSSSSDRHPFLYHSELHLPSNRIISRHKSMSSPTSHNISRRKLAHRGVVIPIRRLRPTKRRPTRRLQRHRLRIGLCR